MVHLNWRTVRVDQWPLEITILLRKRLFYTCAELELCQDFPTIAWHLLLFYYEKVEIYFLFFFCTMHNTFSIRSSCYGIQPDVWLFSFYNYILTVPSAIITAAVWQNFFFFANSHSKSSSCASRSVHSRVTKISQENVNVFSFHKRTQRSHHHHNSPTRILNLFILYVCAHVSLCYIFIIRERVALDWLWHFSSLSWRYIRVAKFKFWKLSRNKLYQ